MVILSIIKHIVLLDGGWLSHLHLVEMEVLSPQEYTLTAAYTIINALYIFTGNRIDVNSCVCEDTNLSQYHKQQVHLYVKYISILL